MTHIRLFTLLLPLSLALLLMPPAAQASVLLGSAANTTGSSNLLSGLIGYWPLNEGSGTAARSIDGANQTMTLSDSPTWSKGKFDSAITLNGSSQYGDIPLTVNYSAFTVSLWFKANSLTSGASPRLAANGHTDTNNPHKGFQLAINNGGTTGFFDVGTGGAADGTASWTYTLSTGTWYHYVGIYDGTNVYAYINGTLVGTGSASGAIAATAYNINIGRNPEYAGDYFNGSIDDVRMYNRALSANEVKMLYGFGAVHIGQVDTTAVASGLVGRWTLDGTAINWTSNTTTDSSGNGNTGILVSLATSSAPVPGKIGQGLRFTGNVSQYVRISGITSLGTANQPYTMSAWIRSSTNSQSADIIHVSDGSDGTGWCLPMLQLSSGVARAVSLIGVSPSIATGATTISAGRWYHLVGTWDASNGLRIYVNGILDGSVAQATYAASGVADYMTIGSPNAGSGCSSEAGGAFSGTIDDVRLYNRALSGTEVALLTTMNSMTIGHSNTTANASRLLGYWTMDGPATNWTTGTETDSSGNGNTLSLINFATTTAPTPGKTGQALTFNGTNSYMRRTSMSSVPSSAMTICTWVKTTYTGAIQYIMSMNRNPSNITNEGVFEIVNGTGALRFWDYNGSTIGFPDGGSDSAASVTNGRWHHACFVKNGTSGTYYIDGGASGTATASVNVSYGTADLIIGQNYRDGNSFFNGSIDDMRVYDRALSAQEIAQLTVTGR